MTPTPSTTTVPITNPAHPQYSVWQILLKVLEVASAIGPAVVTIVDPKDAALATQLGNLSSGITSQLDTPTGN